MNDEFQKRIKIERWNCWLKGAICGVLFLGTIRLLIGLLTGNF